MRWPDSIFLLMAVLALAGGQARAQEAASSGAESAEAETPGAAEEEAKPEKEQNVDVGQTDLGGLDRLLPVGRAAHKVTLPSVDEEGRLTSVTTIAKITRLDQDNFLLEKVDLTSLDYDHSDPATGQPEKTEMKIVTGTYNYATKILTSDKPVRIRKPNMQLVGESLIYDSAAGHAVMKGHSVLVLMTLQVSETAAPESAPDDPTPTNPKPQ